MPIVDKRGAVGRPMLGFARWALQSLRLSPVIV